MDMSIFQHLFLAHREDILITLFPFLEFSHYVSIVESVENFIPLQITSEFNSTNSWIATGKENVLRLLLELKVNLLKDEEIKFKSIQKPLLSNLLEKTNDLCRRLSLQEQLY